MNEKNDFEVALEEIIKTLPPIPEKDLNHYNNGMRTGFKAGAKWARNHIAVSILGMKMSQAK